MRFWTFDTRTGAIVGMSDAAAEPLLPEGYGAIEGDPKILDPATSLYVDATGKAALRVIRDTLPADGWVSVDDAAAIAIADAPTDGDHVLVLVGAYSGTITLTSVGAARSARWTQAKAYRAQRQAAGCVTPAGLVQTDEASQLRIAAGGRAAAAAKAAGQVFSIGWTMTDNSIVQLDADGMIALDTAVTACMTACQAASTAIRAAIVGAASVADVAAVDITAGYPA